MTFIIQQKNATMPFLHEFACITVAAPMGIQRRRFEAGATREQNGMKLFYTDVFVLPLPAEHRFPMAKYERLRHRLEAAKGMCPPSEGSAPEYTLRTPPGATDDELSLAHDPEYIRRVCAGTLSKAEVRRIGFPWSQEMVERSRRSTGATLAAARAALTEGVAANLAGGTHHAGRSHGEGYCVFNDAAVAAHVMRREEKDLRVSVVDCDVHQGNGTAEILGPEPWAFTFSVHGERNFPFRKAAGDLDIGLSDGAGDEDFLQAVVHGTREAIERFMPDVVIYLAGADPYAKDRLGRMNVSKSALAERDRIVLEKCYARGIPVAIAMAGGYADSLEDIVDIHEETVRAAYRLWHAERRGRRAVS